MWSNKTTEGALHHLCSGAIRLLPREPLELRLKKICEKITEIIAIYTPEQVAIEDVFYAVNVKSALKLGHVRGVAMLAAAQAGLQVVAYSPLSIKSAVVGYGKAEKCQVQMMVARLLDLPAPPEPPDVADALAIAICHLHTAGTLRRQHATTGESAESAARPPKSDKISPQHEIVLCPHRTSVGLAGFRTTRRRSGR